MFWFDLAIVPPILLATFFAFHRKIFFAGLLLGVAVLIKQTVIIFLFLFFVFLLLRRTKFKDLVYIFFGPLILGVPLLFRLIQEGALSDFFHWTILYPLTEWGRYPGYVQMSITTREALILFLLFLPLLGSLVINIVRRKLLLDNHLSLLFLFLIGSLIAVYPRFSFFHFQTALAFLIITIMYVLGEWKLKKLLVGFVLFFGVLFPIIHQPVISRDWQKEARFYGKDDIKLAQAIKEFVPDNKSVFLLGPQSGLYVLSNRLPPKRWTDNFGWYLEITGVQEEIISQWEENPPDVVVWRTPQLDNPYDLGTYQPKKIARWIEANYTKEREIASGIWLWKLVPRRNDEG